MIDRIKVFYAVKGSTHHISAYGTVSAPLLATRTLKQVALDNSHEHPEESNEIINNFYVDDYMSISPDLT